jgi:hypothetical protein
MSYSTHQRFGWPRGECECEDSDSDSGTNIVVDRPWWPDDRGWYGFQDRPEKEHGDPDISLMVA